MKAVVVGQVVFDFGEVDRSMVAFDSCSYFGLSYMFEIVAIKFDVVLEVEGLFTFEILKAFV
jgi:hypothetical protein